jgi:hypothetical protein
MNALKQIGTNLLAMAATKSVIIWFLRLASRQTKTGIDDNTVELFDAAYEGDTERLKKAAENILEELNHDDI